MMLLQSMNCVTYIGKLKRELSKIIVGQEQVIEQLAICLFGRGHALLMGVPGLAKTLLGQSHCRDDVAQLQPDSVHSGPDADGHHRH